jgi:hypothetical protein
MNTLDIQELKKKIWAGPIGAELLASRRERMGKIADLANIPDDMRDGFYRELSTVLEYLWTNYLLNQLSYFPRLTKNDEFRNAEQAVRAAKDAIDNLNDDLKNLVYLAMRASENWAPVPEPAAFLEVMVKAFANITKKNPSSLAKGKGSGPGRRKGEVKDWPFQCIVGALFTLPERYGGHLSFDDKDPERGTIPRALKILKPDLPPDVIPEVLPLKTIARIRRNASHSG